MSKDIISGLIERCPARGGLEKLVVGNTYDVDFCLGEPGYSGKAKLASKEIDPNTGLPIYNLVGIGELNKKGEKDGR